MTTRQEKMRSVEEYLRTREAARAPLQIPSALGVGLFMISVGVVVLFFTTIHGGTAGMVRPVAIMVVGFGVAFALLGRRGSAKHRVTETTRYPQQTGELVDLYFQILGENYLWIVVALYIIVLSVFAWQMGQMQL